jgi:hypothetical protein
LFFFREQITNAARTAFLTAACDFRNRLNDNKSIISKKRLFVKSVFFSQAGGRDFHNTAVFCNSPAGKAGYTHLG